jgi:outer membrane protein TolC
MRPLIACSVFLLLIASLPAAGRAGENTELTVAAAVRIALENNLGLQLQQDDVEAAAGVREAAGGEFDVFFSGEAGIGGQEYPLLAPDTPEEERSGQWTAGVRKKFITGAEVGLNWQNSRFSSSPQIYLLDPYYRSSLTLDLRQPLLKGFGIDNQTANLRAADKNLAAATLLVGSEAANLAATVRRAYWNLVYAWQDREVKVLSITLAKRLVTETATKIEAGRLAEVDRYQPESEVARREENLILADRSIGLYEDELKLLMNSADWQATLTPVDLPPTEPVEPDIDQVLQRALRLRPDIQAADLSREAAEIREKAARNQTRPDLALIGMVGQGGTDDVYGDTLDDAIDDPETQWQAGLALSIPLQNATAEGNYRQARAASSKARNSAQLLRLQVRQGVRITLRDVQLAIKAMEATKKTSLATRKRLEAEQAKFEAGRATTLDVLTSQEAYAESLSQEKRAEVGYAIALAELYRIQGMIGPAATP